jgi:AraC-like DNA-binding protein
MRDRVKSYINRHINDPKLSVDRIARAMNCSKRYLHKVFSESEETISHYILTQRLEKCFVQLSHESAKVHTVEQVAYYWGFTSTAHFSRVFKEHFKKTPGQCRQDNAKIN